MSVKDHHKPAIIAIMAGLTLGVACSSDEAPTPAVSETTSDEASSVPAVLRLKQLYQEFLEFKDDAEFREVGWGRCCKYYRWMKNVRGLQDEDLGNFIAEFGILPGELVALGHEYYQGRGDGELAQYYEAIIASGERPIHSEPAIRESIPASNEAIGGWVDIITPTLKEKITIARKEGELVYVGEFSDGGTRSFGLTEIAAKDGQARRFKPEPGSGSAYHGESIAILLNGRLAVYDEYGLIVTVPPQL